MNKPPCDLFIFAGEPSGDLHGQALITELQKIDPDLSIAAVAGPRMRSLGIDCIACMEEFQVMGFVDVFTALPRLIKQFYSIAQQILTLNPTVALFIDYPGFNLRMERHLKKKGFKGQLIHYICPSVWVHGQGRIKTMEASLDQLLCILPFEPACFTGSTLSVSYVGHPLVTRIQSHPFHAIDELAEKKVIALFPGSRSKELERNFPIYLQLVTRLLHKYPELHFAISIARQELQDTITSMLYEHGLGNHKQIHLIAADRTYDRMKRAYIAIAKSGTVILVLALHTVPTVVTYGATRLDIFIAQHILKVDLPYYSLPNILTKKKIFAELIGPHLTIEALEKETEHLLDINTHTLCLQECQSLKALLGEKNASEQVARILCLLLK